MKNLFLGIDAGSTVMKAAVFDTDGQLHAIASRHTPLQRPHPGWVESNPESCLCALDEVIAELVQACENPSAISAIGLSGAMVGAWLLDAKCRVLRPGINWEDSRSQPLLDAMIANQPTMMSEIFSISGSVLQQGCTLPVLAWLKENEPHLLQRTTHVLTYKDMLRHHLTGAIAAERSEAAVLPGDARSQERSAELLELFDLTDLAPLFPEVLNSQDIAGHITASAADRTGLPAGIPVVAGAGDVIANIIGAGGLRSGATTAILGTTCMAGVCHTQPIFTPPDLGLLFSLPEQHWYRAMVNVAGTLNLDWTVRLVAPELANSKDTFTQLTQMVASISPGANGVTYLPYLSASGIIAPVSNPQARAQFCGLHSGHGRADVIRSVYEGVAFAIADLIDLLSPPEGEPVVLTGGGSQSELWCQMIADVTGRSIKVPAGTEFGARGVALLAATAMGHFDSIMSASESVTGDGTLYTPATNAEQTWSTARKQFIAYRDKLLA